MEHNLKEGQADMQALRSDTGDPGPRADSARGRLSVSE